MWNSVRTATQTSDSVLIYRRMKWVEKMNNDHVNLQWCKERGSYLLPWTVVFIMMFKSIQTLRYVHRSTSHVLCRRICRGAWQSVVFTIRHYILHIGRNVNTCSDILKLHYSRFNADDKVSRKSSLLHLLNKRTSALTFWACWHCYVCLSVSYLCGNIRPPANRNKRKTTVTQPCLVCTSPALGASLSSWWISGKYRATSPRLPVAQKGRRIYLEVVNGLSVSRVYAE